MTPLRTVILFVMFAGLWALWSGHLHDIVPTVFGVISIVLVLWLGQRMGTFDDEGYPIRQAVSIVLYLPWIVWQIFKSNLEVARIILDPKLPISPSIFRLKVSQKTDLGLAIHANSITVTPGTISLDVRDNHILVHALTGAAAAEDEGGDMDERVTRIERSA